MRYTICLIVSLLIIAIAGLIPVAADGDGQSTVAKPAAVTWEVPIAAGVYYPKDGPMPENPVRYYRVRCWPGCHTGSSLGKYPEKELVDKPIFPTSTIDGHKTQN